MTKIIFRMLQVRYSGECYSRLSSIIFKRTFKSRDFGTRLPYNSPRNVSFSIQCACGRRVLPAVKSYIYGQSVLFRRQFSLFNVFKSLPTKDKTTTKELRRLLGLARPERWKIGGAVALLLIFSSISISVPYFIGKLIDIMYTSTDNHDGIMSSLRETCFGLSFLFFIGAAANLGRLYILETAGQQIIQRLRKRAFTAIISQEIAFFDKRSSGELINRLSSDTTLVGKALTENVSGGLRACVTAVGGISLMVYTSPQLTMLALTVVPPVVLFSVMYGRFVRSITKKTQDKLAQSSQVAEERFSNMRTVRAFAQEHKEMKTYNSTIDDVFALAKKEALARASFFGFNTLSGNLMAIAVLYNGGLMMIDSQITVGSLTSFLMYTVYVGISINGLGSFFSELMKGLGASTRIWEIIDKKPLIPLHGGAQMCDVITDQSIHFRNVAFTYPSRPTVEILKHFNLRVPSGSVIAIVGESGSGKSTIASLLLRHYDIAHGTIEVGNHNIQSFNPSSLREYIGTVSQEPVLFSTTIAENISYGASMEKAVQFEDIVEAARQANAYNFVTSFPQGFDTVVGERGQMLSGGQRQRIAIARAIYKNPKILLLDEATSALDAESEHLVVDALQRLMSSRTTVIIAHRLSTIKNADQIAVLQEGSIAELGTYKDLMEIENGTFRQLVEKQSFET